MAPDEPSAQIRLDLQSSIQSALTSPRPILHHLNADTSWFLQIPRPAIAVRNGARVYYNILIDPWLAGGQSDVASWFSQQFHATPSAVGSIAELEELARGVEAAASGFDQERGGKKGRSTTSGEGDGVDTPIDAVFISHEFTDHCHRETLLQIHPGVPVFATKEAAKLIGRWKHFRTVIAIPPFGHNGDRDWRSTSVRPLPEWIGVGRLLQTGDALKYHAALVISFHAHNAGSVAEPAPTDGHANRRRDEPVAEMIIYTPHGIHSDDLTPVSRASPALRPLALLHGLHNVRVGTASGRTALQSNLGAHNGLRAQRMLGARHWIGTHDEVKKGGGLVAWFLQRDATTLDDALDEERRQRLEAKDGGDGKTTTPPPGSTNWVELGNGESRVLT